MIEKVVLVFMMMFSLDVVWALYTLAVGRNKAVAAATFASLIQLFSAGLVFEYTKEPLLALPAAAGAFAGTYAVMCPALRKIAASLGRRRPPPDRGATDRR